MMIRASFDRAERWEAAVLTLRHGGQREVEIFSPAPCPQLERLLSPSPVKFFTLLGALVGFKGGLLLTIGTALAWPLLTGGKAIVSLPPLLVIFFELTILCASLANLLGMIGLGGLPFSGRRGYHPAFSGDRFGIVVGGLSAQQAEILAGELRAGGAAEVAYVE